MIGTKRCGKCGVEIHYFSTPTRGAWHDESGSRFCKTVPDGHTPYQHMPAWDFETRTWK